MKIVIVGAGIIGVNLAEYFARQKHHIAVIEQDEGLCEKITSKLDIFTVCGIGSSPEALVAAGIDSADMIIAVTPSDEINLLACHFAMQKGVKKRIARVKSDVYTGTQLVDLSVLGVTNVIEPERELVDKVLQYVDLPGVTETANFEENSIYLRGYKVHEKMPIAGKTIVECMHTVKDAPMLIVLILRGGQSIPAVGHQRIEPGDEIVVIMPKTSFSAFRTMIRQPAQKFKKIIVSGDTLTAIHLAEAVKNVSEQVVLLDPNREHGERASAALAGVDVFHADSTDSDVLHEVHIDRADYFIAAGADSEDNVMSCLLAKSAGAERVIAVRNDNRHREMFGALGIDYVVNPSDITLNLIIEKIQIASIGSYLKLDNAESELVRLVVDSKSRIAGKELRALDGFIKRSIVIGCIIRDGRVIIPCGETVMHEGDEVLVVCGKSHLDWVYKSFNAKAFQ